MDVSRFSLDEQAFLTYLKGVAKDKTHNSTLKFDVRFFIKPKLWVIWYTEVEPVRKYITFNVVIIGLNGLVEDTKPYRVMSKSPPKTSVSGDRPFPYAIERKGKKTSCLGCCIIRAPPAAEGVKKIVGLGRGFCGD